jgi:hypothetical protein
MDSSWEITFRICECLYLKQRISGNVIPSYSVALRDYTFIIRAIYSHISFVFLLLTNGHACLVVPKSFCLPETTIIKKCSITESLHGITYSI